jgi:hypothetical protein
MHRMLVASALLTLCFSLAVGIPFASSAIEIGSRQQTLVDCLSEHDVPTKLISSSDWESFMAPYNLALQYEAAAITLPETATHVSDSVTCAAEAGVKVQAKSGGHSYASFSSGGKNGSLIIDLENFNSISVDNSKQTSRYILRTP